MLYQSVEEGIKALEGKIGFVNYEVWYASYVLVHKGNCYRASMAPSSDSRTYEVKLCPVSLGRIKDIRALDEAEEAPILEQAVKEALDNGSNQVKLPFCLEILAEP